MKKIKALLYCTKAKTELFKTEKGIVLTDFGIGDYFKQKIKLNGTIPCECEIEVEEIYNADLLCGFVGCFRTKDMQPIELEERSCLTSEELDNYLKGKNGYALHISNLKVFDKPRELSEYCSLETEEYAYHDWQGYHNQLREKELKKAPQNMMTAYEKNILTNHLGDFPNHKYILISIQPQWLCKILNGEKDIEIRKQVLNYMKE